MGEGRWRTKSLRDPSGVGGHESHGGPLQPPRDVGEPVEELGLDHQPEVLLAIFLPEVAEPLRQLLLEVLLLVQHKLGVRHHEVVAPRLLPQENSRSAP